MNRDLKNNVIDQRAKDSQSIEINGVSKFCGHRFLLKTKLYGDKRCLYCGKWFHWKDTECITWLKENNIDNMNLDGALEPLHCNSSHCQEYHRLCLIAAERCKKEELEDMEQRSLRLFKHLKSRGMVV